MAAVSKPEIVFVHRDKTIGIMLTHPPDRSIFTNTYKKETDVGNDEYSTVLISNVLVQ